MGCARPLPDARSGEQGATIPEYGLLLALIAAVCVGVIGAIGSDLAALFERVAAVVGGP